MFTEISSEEYDVTLPALVTDSGMHGSPLDGAGTALGLFEGISPGATDVLVKYTNCGDANLDGRVDGSDYSLIDKGHLSDLTGWSNGDFNYDGVIDGSDYSLIDNVFNTQGASLTAAISAPTSQLAAPTSAVPEPATISLLAVGVLSRRRRKRIDAAIVQPV